MAVEFCMRPWQEGDEKDVAVHANNEKIARNLRNAFPHPYTLADAEWFVNDCMAKEGEGQFCRAIVLEGEVIGSIGLFRGADVYRCSAELGYWLAEEHWNEGIMSRAIRVLCRAAFEDWDVDSIHAEPFAENTASRRVLEKAGFTLAGTLRRHAEKNGQLMDTCLYDLIREESLL